jgi:hypothetical protein
MELKYINNHTNGGHSVTITHNQIIEALNNLAPIAEWTLEGDDYSKIVWSSNDTQPTFEQLSAEIAAIPGRKAQAETDAIAAKSAAQAKLAALGLTVDDLAALGL